jgi:hypothetical protein
MHRAWATSIWIKAVRPTWSALSGHSSINMVLRCRFTDPAIRRMCEISTMVNGSCETSDDFDLFVKN